MRNACRQNKMAKCEVNFVYQMFFVFPSEKSGHWRTGPRDRESTRFVHGTIYESKRPEKTSWCARHTARSTRPEKTGWCARHTAGSTRPIIKIAAISSG